MDEQNKEYDTDKTSVDAANRFGTDTKPRDKEKSRSMLAYVILVGYMILIVFAFLSPFAVKYYIGFPANVEPSDKIIQIVNAYMGALTGLTGLVGFVVGYYFKNEDKNEPNDT